MTCDDARIAPQLAASLPSMRWFADKGAGIVGVNIYDRASLPRDTAAEIALADVKLAGRDPSSQSPRYVVMIDAAGDDATATPAVARWLLDLVLSGRSLSSRNGRFVGHATGHSAHAASVAPTGPVTVSPIGGDASNTSLVVRSGSTGWIIKLFRRCRAGIQPEVEVGEFFAASSPWQDTPRLYGWLEYVPDGDQLAATSTAIATVHEFVPGYTTGWDRLVGLLTAGNGLAGRAGEEVFGIVAALGRATGRMHRAFSMRPDIPAFAPESATPVGRQAAALEQGLPEDVDAAMSIDLTDLDGAIDDVTGVLGERDEMIGIVDVDEVFRGSHRTQGGEQSILAPWQCTKIWSLITTDKVMGQVR